MFTPNGYIITTPPILDDDFLKTVPWGPPTL